MNEELVPPAGKFAAAMREIYDWLESGLTAVAFAVLLFAFVGRTIAVVGDSMFPTLADRERLITTPITAGFQTGDIVVVTKPNINGNKPLIKRVIAGGGQTVFINFDHGEVWVDGELLDEPYISEPTTRFYDLAFPQTVPEGHVFVMGDNRNNSWDSRDSGIGMIDERYILGTVVFRFLPPDRIGIP